MTDFCLWINRVSRCLEVAFSNLSQVLKKGRIILKFAFSWSVASVFFCHHFRMVLLFFRVGTTQGFSIIVNSHMVAKKTLRRGRMNLLK